MVGRGSIDVIHVELLEPEDRRAERPAQPVSGGRSDRAEPDDDRVPLAAGLPPPPLLPPPRAAPPCGPPPGAGPPHPPWLRPRRASALGGPACCHDVYPPASPRVRRRARRSTARTVITSLMRPSSVIPRTSSNGSQRIAKSSVPSGVADPWLRPVARNRTATSSVTLLERWTRASSRQSVASTPVSSLSSRRAPSSAVSSSGTPPSGSSHE